MGYVYLFNLFVFVKTNRSAVITLLAGLHVFVRKERFLVDPVFDHVFVCIKIKIFKWFGRKHH